MFRTPRRSCTRTPKEYSYNVHLQHMITKEMTCKHILIGMSIYLEHQITYNKCQDIHKTWGLIHEGHKQQKNNVSFILGSS